MATATATTPKKSKAKIRFKPLDDRILLEPCEAEEVTAGGIVLPDSAREKPQRGHVIAVGPGKLLDSGERGQMSVKMGDEVLYGKYSGTEIDFSGDKYIVIRENDLLGIVE
ncbi:MAG: co-chaperone GroES [Phycisphaerales bacterium]|nr:MAG: co-chaperone GroES [Phycisphaerales bacterium]